MDAVCRDRSVHAEVAVRLPPDLHCRPIAPRRAQLELPRRWYDLLAILSSTIAFAWCDSTCRIFVVVAIRDGIDAGYGCGDNDGTGWLIAHGVEVVVLGIVMFRLRHFRDDFGTSCPATPAAADGS